MTNKPLRHFLFVLARLIAFFALSSCEKPKEEVVAPKMVKQRFAKQAAPPVKKGKATKTWYVRYQLIPEVALSWVTADWSYADLNGKEEALLTRNVLLVTEDNFNSKRTIKDEVEFFGDKIKIVLSIVLNPNYPKQGAKYVPLFQLLRQGEKPFDFYFGDVAPAQECFIDEVNVKYYATSISILSQSRLFTTNRCKQGIYKSLKKEKK